MGGLIVRGVPWALGLLGLGLGAKSAGEGLGDGLKTGLMLAGAGAAVYLITRKGR